MVLDFAKARVGEARKGAGGKRAQNRLIRLGPEPLEKKAKNPLKS
jgi:hypothetical protein